MKRLYPTTFIAIIVITAIAASVKISDLTLSTSPSTNTFLEIADMNDTPKSKKYLLTNLVTQSAFTSATNSITTSAANWTADGTTNSTLAGNARANAVVATNGITAGASTFTGTVTVPQLITYSVRPRNLVLTHAGTVTLDFSTNTYQKLVLTGAVTLAFSNLETNRTYQLTIANSQATNCSYVLPAVTYMGYYPTNIVAYKSARWWFDVDPQTNSIVYATYAEQQ